MYRRVSVIGLICTMCILSLTLCACESSSQTDNPNEVVASINNVSVSRGQIESRVKALKQEHAAEDDGKWKEFLSQNNLTPQMVRQRVLERLITEILVTQDAEKHNITIDASYVDDQIQSLKANYPTEQAWHDALEANGYDEASYRHAVELNLLTQKVQRDLIDKEDLSDEQLIRYIKAKGSDFECRRSSHILFAKSNKEQAEKVLAKIKAGASFEACAHRYSVDNASKDQGGDIGWDYEAHFVDEYQSALKKLHVGEVSGLVESQFGYHIIKCTDKYPLIKDDQHLKQIPEDLRELIYQSLTKKLAAYQFEVYLRSLRNQADIKVFDKEFGDPAHLIAAGSDSPVNHSDMSDDENLSVTPQDTSEQAVQTRESQLQAGSETSLDLYNNPDVLSDQALDLMIQDLKKAS